MKNGLSIVMRGVLCVLLLAGACAQAQSVRCLPGFGPPQPGDGCDGTGADVRNPLPDGYLAIALSGEPIAGAAWSPSKVDAQRQAVASCTRSGGRQCRIVESYLNTCASVAASPSDKVVAISALKGAGWNASGMALTKCRSAGGRSCRVLVSGCANGYMSSKPYEPPSTARPYEAPVLRRR